MKKLLLATAVVVALGSQTFAQVSDADLARALDACSQHQQTSSVGDKPAAYSGGWEHCENIRQEFLKRKNTPNASPDFAPSKSIAEQLKAGVK